MEKRKNFRRVLKKVKKEKVRNEKVIKIRKKWGKERHIKLTMDGNAIS